MDGGVGVDLNPARKQFQYPPSCSLVQIALLSRKAMTKTDLLYENKSKSKRPTAQCWHFVSKIPDPPYLVTCPHGGSESGTATLRPAIGCHQKVGPQGLGKGDQDKGATTLFQTRLQKSLGKPKTQQLTKWPLSTQWSGFKISKDNCPTWPFTKDTPLAMDPFIAFYHFYSTSTY